MACSGNSGITAWNLLPLGSVNSLLGGGNWLVSIGGSGDSFSTGSPGSNIGGSDDVLGGWLILTGCVNIGCSGVSSWLPTDNIGNSLDSRLTSSGCIGGSGWLGLISSSIDPISVSLGGSHWHVFSSVGISHLSLNLLAHFSCRILIFKFEYESVF